MPRLPWAQMLNVGLRLGSLIAKLGLALYMGRYLSLQAMGLYGLVFGAVMIFGGLVGFRLDYIVARDIVRASPSQTLARMRDQAVFYTLNYLGILVVLGGVAATQGLRGLDGKALAYVLALSVLEGYASITYINMNSLERPVRANLLFFLRGGAWIFPVVLLGWLIPSFRTVETILNGWLIGVMISLLATLWTWRVLPWRTLRDIAVDWGWIRKGVRICLPIWLGTLGLSLGVYTDRFVVTNVLGLDKAGVATFYFSFATAVLTLIQSGVLSFIYPRLIAYHREGNAAGFRHEARQAAWQVALFAGVMTASVGIGVPVLAHLFNRPELVAEEVTLWLMLGGIWIRCNAETLYNVLFARHQDRPVWLGNLLFLLPALGGNLVLVPLMGFSGIGVSMILGSLFLLLWRGWFVLRKDFR